MTTQTAVETIGYAAEQPTTPLAPFRFARRATGPRDVRIDVLYCGVCHSDIHQSRDEWGGAIFPMVPGHEIVGRVIETGDQVTRFRDGDIAAVGCMVDSCRHCASCAVGLEQYCETGTTWTYNARDAQGAIVFGGYSKTIVVDEGFVFSVSPSLDLAAAAPLLCAGITTYSPLRLWNVGPGSTLGVVGLGGLGHMALKFGRAFGAHVVQFTTSRNKTADAKRLGADEVVLSSDAAAMASRRRTFDFILDTVSAPHDMAAYLDLLKVDGTMTLVGVPDAPLSIPPFSLVARRARLAGSAIGGVAETQAMLDYCAERRIVADVEVIPMQQINQAYDRMLASDVKYRFVIDMSSLG
jgi:alcohol dehydrogenase (NADP+)